MQTECETTKTMIDAGEFDTLKNTRRVKPITLQNRYEAFQEDNESDDDGDEEISNNSIAQTWDNWGLSNDTNYCYSY